MTAPSFRSYFFVLMAIFALWPTQAFAQGNLREVPPSDPQYELDRLNIAEGFELTLFASDPMIEKPIQMTWDEYGRLWIVGSAVYPHLLPGQEPDDKIFILEDTDGDGAADKSTVFADGLLTPTGILVGDGGAYVANSTELLHLRDLDGDGYAEDRRVVLRGFGADDTHHIIHAFRWGPGGMMYINQSIYIFSHIETPWGVRRLRQGGVWHFRPETMELDVFARGFYNPWGHSFDAWGQSFVTDGAGYTGINHIFPEAAFEATYKAERVLPGLNENQPKYAGLAIISGRHMPDSLQGHMITNDYRANRVNRFVVTDEKDRYVSTLAGDLVWSDHVAFRPVDVSVGPDGALYLADWYNPIIQHGEVDFRDPRRDHIHGRIWRITAKDRPTVDIPDLPGASVDELLDMLRLPELWTRRQARRLLKEKGTEAVHPALTAWVAGLSAGGAEDYERLRLEGLWLHQALGVVDENLLGDVLASSDYRVRAAAVRVLYHWLDRVENAESMLESAIADEAMRVRREALSALALLDSPAAARIAMKALDAPMSEEVDFALWHAIRALEPHWAGQLDNNPEYFGEDLNARLFAWKAVHTPEAIDHLLDLYVDEKLPEEEATEVLDLIVQYGEEADLNHILNLALSGEEKNGQNQIRHLEALKSAISTFGKTPSENTGRIASLLSHESDEIQLHAIELAGYWKLAETADALIDIAQNTDDESLQRTALMAAAQMDDARVETRLNAMLDASQPTTLRVQAAAALVMSDPEEATPLVVDLLNDLEEDADASPLFSAVYSRNQSKRILAEALQTSTIPAHFATIALENYRGNRQRDRDLLEALVALGGVEEQQSFNFNMNAWNRDRLELDVKSAGDPVAGEDVYRRPALACMRCHAIGGAGGLVGPDLSSIGANAPTDYIIESLIEPQKAVKDGFALTSVTRTDGQVLMGTLVRDTGTSLLLRDASDALVTVPNNLIEKQEILPGSLMPAGLLASLSREEFINLVAFLSQLGESGDFRVPAEPYVRNWRTAPLSPAAGESLEAINEIIAGEGRALYSRVDGSLHVDDFPSRTDGQAASLLWFYLDVESDGGISLQVNSNLGLRFIVENKILPVEGNSINFSLPPGNYPITIVLNHQERGDLPLFIELRPSESSARVQLVQRDTDD